MTTATRGRSAATDRSDSSPSTTSQPFPAPALRAELRHLAADDPARVAPGLAQRERDHRRRRRLAVRARDDDRRRRARPARRGARRAAGPPRAGYAVETNTSQPSGASGSRRDPHLDPRLAHRAEVRRLVRGPSRRPPRPTPRASSPYAESPAPPIPTSQMRLPLKRARAISSSAISSAASGFAAARIASPIAPSRAPSASSSRTTSGTRAISASGTTTTPPASSK